MYKFLFGVLIAAVCFQPSFGQPVIKKTLPAVKKGLQNTLGNTQAVRAQSAFQNARKKPLRAAPKAPVHPSVPVAGGALPAYSLDINSLLSEEDRFIINNSAYFDKMPPAPRADMTAKEKYLHMRNKRVNALEKLVWAKRLDFVRKNIDPIADNLRIKVQREAINYLNYIPQDVRFLYLGENHFVPSIKEEVMDILYQLRTRWPQRTIILFTEFLADTVYIANGPVPGEVSRSYGGVVWEYAHELGIPVVGVENAPLWNDLNNPNNAERFGVYMDATARRNERWVQHMRPFMEKEPDALFVVYAGGAHTDASFTRNLPALVGEKKSYIISFDVPGTKAAYNPVFNYIGVPEELEQEFLKNKNYKLLTLTQNGKYKKLIGFDLSVTVHNPQ